MTEEEALKEIGIRIKELRKDRDLTQEQLAEKINYSDGYVSHIELGKANISLKLLFNMADVLNEDIEYFLSIFQNIEKNSLDSNSKYNSLNKENKKLIDEIIALFYRSQFEK